MQLATEKQIDFIHAIEDMLGVEFHGETKKEASAFINEYVDEFYEEQHYRNELDAVVLEFEMSRWG